MNLPDYNFLPAPLWLVTSLHIVTLTLHFAAMNFLFGGLIVLLFGGIPDKWHDPAVNKIVKLFPTAMAATVTLGVAPLLFLQLAYYKQVYAASIVSGWFWLMIAAAVIVSYYFLYGSAFADENRRGKVPAFSAIALIGLTYVSLVYSSVFSLAERPDLYRDLYAGNQSGGVFNSEVGAWILRWLHMLSGAVAVGGFFVGLFGRGNDPVYKLGRNFFLWGAVGATVVGLGYLFTLGEYLAPFMRSAAIWLLVLAIVLTLVSLHLFFKKKFLLACILVTLSLAGMVSIRHVLRLIVLEGKFDPATIPVHPQWSVFVVFLVFFLIAIALVWYMVRLVFTDRAQQEH